MKNPKVLIVEDESLIALELKIMLQGNGYSLLEVASTSDQAVSFAEKHKPDIILMDILLKGTKTGIDAACQIFFKIVILSEAKNLLRPHPRCFDGPLSREAGSA